MTIELSTEVNTPVEIYRNSKIFLYRAHRNSLSSLPRDPTGTKSRVLLMTLKSSQVILAI